MGEQSEMQPDDDYSDEAEYGYCNACGEEMQEGDECCDDGEWVPYDPPVSGSRDGSDGS